MLHVCHQVNNFHCTYCERFLKAWSIAKNCCDNQAGEGHKQDRGKHHIWVVSQHSGITEIETQTTSTNRQQSLTRVQASGQRQAPHMGSEPALGYN